MHRLPTKSCFKNLQNMTNITVGVRNIGICLLLLANIVLIINIPLSQARPFQQIMTSMSSSKSEKEVIGAPELPRRHLITSIACSSRAVNDSTAAVCSTAAAGPNGTSSSSVVTSSRDGSSEPISITASASGTGSSKSSSSNAKNN